MTQSSSNKSPVIRSFKSSSSTAKLPCPSWTVPTMRCPEFGMTLELMTEASGKNKDTLLYQYSVNGGRVLGEGANVKWNLIGASPGSYTAKVVVKNQRGGMAASSLSVKVVECPDCEFPCNVVVVSCPDQTEEGPSVIFTAKVLGGEPGIKPTYKWSVSIGTIVKGQGTDTIEVDTSNLGGQQLEAKIEIGGHPPECQNMASCKVQVRKKSAK
jgi:hypothetical protein